ncbi:MAG: response regulator [Chloroflexi bacterium]|nr:response regulator [Chloroflexota bacterium]
MSNANNKQRILIVDDDERIVELIVNGLSEHSAFETHAFTTGQAAREAIERFNFDLIVSDWMLPDVDGLTLIRAAKTNHPDCVTILMTAFGAPDVQELPEFALVHHYLEKPFTVDELITLITTTLAPTTAPPQVEEPAPRVFKVVLGGDANVGKTSLIQRYCTGVFEPTRAMTIGVDFHVYDIRLDNEPVRLVVWDLGGQERFAFARHAFYHGTQAIGLVFDVSNRVSFYNLMRWWREAREFLGDTPAVLLANKTDLPRQISREETESIAESWGMKFYESSCASGDGVPQFFEALAWTAWENAQKNS